MALTEEVREPDGAITEEAFHSPAALAQTAGAVLLCSDHANTPRWQAGERLHHLFAERCNELRAAGRARHPALDIDGHRISFDELDAMSARLARKLAHDGIGAGDRVALLLDRSAQAYAALLAVLKLEAAYVPLDAKYPRDRIAYIIKDAGATAAITTPEFATLLDDIAIRRIDLHEAAQAAGDERADCRCALPRPGKDDQLCYIIYTSGSTGRPKGVAVNHSSICNFVRIAADLYGYQSSDRVYQGLSLAFDFSVEELFVPLMAGATLVPAPTGTQLIGRDLAGFLRDRNVTALCCVPTLLATIEDDLPDLRFLLISGEACPPDLVERWHRPGRRLLNAYGPTEATVTATWSEPQPGRQVTIGRPLPTYQIAILDPDAAALVPSGSVGEIAIGGIGLAEGYVNRPDLTAEAFIPDFLRLADNPSGRLYRTGDLGRITPDGEIEYLGRIDTQVKIRGYRIELAEIENVLLQVPGIAQAVVTTHEVAPGQLELAAYYTAFDDKPPALQDMADFLRQRLPGYMIPAFVEELRDMPLLASQKVDRKSLPAPTRPRFTASQRAFVAPRTTIEGDVARLLAETLGLERVSVDDDFFAELGAHSFVMARFVAALDAKFPGAGVSIADVYLEPTVARLAQRIDTRGLDGAVPSRAEEAHVADDRTYWLCGTIQFAFYATQFSVYVFLAWLSGAWLLDAATSSQLIQRALTVSGAWLIGTSTLAIAAKWILVGRWQPARIPLWSLGFVRFWIVRQLIETSPIILFRGSPLYNVFLRLLGARIGRDVLMFPRRVPIITDLLSIGSGTVIRKETVVTGYKVENGYLCIGAVDIGNDVVIGDGAVVDIDTAMGDGAQLAHASCLPAGQSIPAGRSFHGSPAQETAESFRYAAPGRISSIRKALYSTGRFATVWIGLALASTVVVQGLIRFLFPGIMAGGGSLTLLGLATTAAAILVLSYAALLAINWTVPKLLAPFLKPGRDYPVYGIRYSLAELMTWTGTALPLQLVFGDSSFITRYFGWIGLRQPDLQQTGSNFGNATMFESPRHCTIGSGAMVSDGLWVMNMELSNASFRMANAHIGAGSFLGNTLFFPAAARVGDNCLLGSKVMLPLQGDIRENVGLLGSPCFEIPRKATSKEPFDPIPKSDEALADLHSKDAYNLRTVGLFAVTQWLLLAGLLWLSQAVVDIYATHGPGAAFATMLAIPVLAFAYFVATEWASLGLRRLRPRDCTIHAPYYWHIERHWKFAETPLKYLFPGTPFRPMIMRCLGIRVGRKVYDDGTTITEKTLTEIGDGCCLNVEAKLQPHSLEDGLFKSDRIVLGPGTTIGPAAYIHYGVVTGENTVVEADAFLMKGNRTEPYSRWRGNPAKRC